MTIYEKRRYVWMGIIASVFILAMVAFGEYVGVSDQQSVFADAKLKGVLFLFGAAIFVGIVTWLMGENEKLEQYRTAAITDPLTRLLNRQGKEKALMRLFSTEFREGHRPSASQRIEAAVIYIDVDRFKKLNDIAGHAAGDQALIVIADLIQNVFKRATDIVVREGGDEFIVILSHADVSVARERAENLLAAAHASDDLHRIKARYDVNLTLSIGIASSIIETGKPWTNAEYTLGTASEAADKSMYEAKRAGGDRISTWNPVVFGG